MKAGEIYIAHVEDSEHVDGHEFRLVKEVDFQPMPPSRPKVKMWLTVDDATGREHHWSLKHFKTVLTLKV